MSPELVSLRNCLKASTAAVVERPTIQSLCLKLHHKPASLQNVFVDDYVSADVPARTPVAFTVSAVL